MRRKIPAKKHRGIRDPLKQRAERFEKIKDKIDNPPEKEDYQKISRSLADFIRLKEETKKGNLKRKHGIEDVPKPYVKNGKMYQPRPYKELPEFKQGKIEKDISFIKRVQYSTSEALKEAQYEAKYNVDVIRKDNGEIQIKKRKSEEILQLSKEGKNDEKSIKGIQKKKHRIDKRKLKREQKQQERLAEKEEHEKLYKRENIKFGEICHGPPNLKVLPKSSQAPETVPRPGKRDLLLNSFLDMNKKESKKTEQKKNNQKPVKNNKTDLKGKRKDLPIRTRQMLEDEQRAVVEKYRELKKLKMPGIKLK